MTQARAYGQRLETGRIRRLTDSHLRAGCWVATSLLWLLMGCAAREVTVIPGDRHRIERPVSIEEPPVAAAAYAEMVECTGTPPVVSLAEIEWLGAAWIYEPATGRYPHAIAYPPPLGRIVVVLDHLDHVGVIGHEILHLLLPAHTHWSPRFDACDPILHWRLTR